MREFCKPLFVVVCMMISAKDAAAQFVSPVTVQFNAADGSWNSDANWLTVDPVGVSVPGKGLSTEIVGISNGGTATLTTPAQFPVSGLIIGETGQFPDGGPATGTLSISGTGALNVSPVAGAPFTDGVRVGFDGAGTLNMTGGSANFSNLHVGGNAASAVNLSGGAALTVAGAANMERVTRITGPGVNFNTDALRVRGTFVSEITGPTHSAITVTGAADLGGTLQVEFNGHTPTFGESWTLVNAGSVGGVFDNVDVSAAPLPSGLVFDLDYNNAGAGGVKLSLNNRLVLKVNQGTGHAMIKNVVGGAVDIDGYSISSPGGLLSTSAWNSLEDQNVDSWGEANPTNNNLNELRSAGFTTLAADPQAGLDLGNPYTPTAFGQAADLAFEYSTPSGTVQGLVELEGHNNLVLLVDSVTGSAGLRNDSPFPVSIDGYTIRSASGSLDPEGWNSLSDQGVGGWNKANPTINGLSEIDQLGALLLNPGDSHGLGELFSVGGLEDLQFEFRIADGAVRGGGVEFSDFCALPLLFGDTNADGVIDLIDLNNVRNNFGAVGPADGTLTGDAFTPGEGFDGIVDLNDLSLVRNHFGRAADCMGVRAVPEPSTVLLSLVGAVGLFVWGANSRRRLAQ